MQNIVITIGREYGSGGRYIGELIAKKLKIPFYDKEILAKTYEKYGCNYSKLESMDESKRNRLLSQLELLSLNHYDDEYASDTYYLLMNNTIKEIAETGSCVILGRNANNLLRDKKNTLHLFIYSNDDKFKINRKMQRDNLSYDETVKRLKYVDNKRRKYYESVNKNAKWGSRKEYDYLIDSSILGVEKTADWIVELYHQYQTPNSD